MEPAQIGKYRIVGKLGQGAMGEVFRAHDPTLKRDVAIKVISGKLSADERHRDRFLREARAAAKRNHPNIITVYEADEHEGQPFISMELLEGSDLRELIEKKRITSIEDKLVIMEQILDGLAFAHRNGVVHRDLKPGNIFILKENLQVKIMDFGLARRKEDGAASGAVMGTPYYMAPEQAQGERSTASSDIFSIGAVFYELLTGKRPFPGTTVPTVLYAVVHKDPEPLQNVVPELPLALVAIVQRALAKNPESRYRDGEEMLEALRTFLVGGEIPDVTAVMPTVTVPARELGTALSAAPETDPALKAAVQEIEQYLADRVPPLIVADSVDELMRAPVPGTAAEIWGWAERQRKRHPEDPLARLLIYAVYKLSMIGGLDLVDVDRLLAFLREVGALLVEACPPDQREQLRAALLHLGEWDLTSAGLAEFQKRDQKAAELKPLKATTPGLRRLALLEQRLRRLAGSPADPARRGVVSQALTAAAFQSRNESDLAGYLSRLNALGVPSGADHVFRALGDGLVEWALPDELAADTADIGPAPEVEAMRRIVSLPEDAVEIAGRYRHLVSAAVGQFNEGNLGRAVQMLELAAKLASEKEVDPVYVGPVRGRGHESLDPGRLREYMEKTDRHRQLQAVMEFFEPGLGVSKLLDQLEVEERRDRRRLLLDLLAVHGDRARALAVERLQASIGTEGSDFARRNWIYLLRQVPLPSDAAADEEVQTVSRFAGPANPLFLVKEALGHLGQTPHPSATRALLALLERWESHLAEGDLDPMAREDGQAALDRLAAALARQGSSEGWEALLDHAFARRSEHGATMERLRELGTQDLSTSAEVVGHLVAEVEDCLPRGVLGRLVGRRGADLEAVVAALAGTRAPEARAALKEVAQRAHSQEAGRAAARALAAPAAPPAAPLAGWSGELEAYGLPSLLQRLRKEEATGRLTLRPEVVGEPARLAFAKGRVVLASWGRLQGAEVVYQFFERPFAGTFAFDAAPPPAGATVLPTVQNLVREGIRRARELQRTSVLLPDDTALEATGTAPSTVPEEPDYPFVVTLWEKACARVPIGQIESQITADAYRIRHALAHWVEEGALRPLAPPDAASAPSEPAAPGT